MHEGVASGDLEKVLDIIRAEGLRYRQNNQADIDRIVVLGEIPDGFQDKVKLPCVQDIVSLPYRLVSRAYHPDDTVVDVNGVKIGGDNPPVMVAGPCSVSEDKSFLLETAHAVKGAGAQIFRGSAYKPRTSPHDFQGVGQIGLEYMQEAGQKFGLQTISEAVGEGHVDPVSNYISIIHVGSRNCQSFQLLIKAGKVAYDKKKPVLLKRGMWTSLTDFLCAAEYIANEGCDDIILCLRGVSPSTGHTRYRSDMDEIPALRELTHLPVIWDPSHSTGHARYVPESAMAAIALGAQALMVEASVDPSREPCDAKQHVTPATLKEMVQYAKSQK